MFKIAEKRIVEWPVTISVPQKGGAVKKFQSRVEFEHLEQPEFDAVYADGNDTDLLMRVVRGWPDGEFQDADGQPMQFSEENLARLMRISYVRSGFVGAYLQIAAGREAQRKN